MSNDDIVEYLRRIAEVAIAADSDLGGLTKPFSLTGGILEAADEIERLRKELASTQSDLQRIEMKYIRELRRGNR